MRFRRWISRADRGEIETAIIKVRGPEWLKDPISERLWDCRQVYDVEQYLGCTTYEEIARDLDSLRRMRNRGIHPADWPAERDCRPFAERFSEWCDAMES